MNLQLQCRLQLGHAVDLHIYPDRLYLGAVYRLGEPNVPV